MSASGATIQRPGIHVPMLPILALVAVVVATGLTLRVMNDVRQAEPAAAVQEAEGYWGSTVGHPTSPRQGARLTMIDVVGPEAFEASTAAVRELPAPTPQPLILIVDHIAGHAPAPPAQHEGSGDCVRCTQRR